jgi:uncharacterized NAD(P)/FAD-binding protein YdhS
MSIVTKGNKMSRYKELVSRQRKMRMVSFIASADGLTLSGPDSLNMTMADTGTGIKTLTLSEPFADANYIVMVTTATADSVAQVSISSKSEFIINTFDSTDGTTAKDAICHVMVLGSDTTDKFKG